MSAPTTAPHPGRASAVWTASARADELRRTGRTLAGLRDDHTAPIAHRQRAANLAGPVLRLAQELSPADVEITGNLPAYTDDGPAAILSSAVTDFALVNGRHRTPGDLASHIALYLADRGYTVTRTG